MLRLPHLPARHFHMKSVGLMDCNPGHVLFNHVDSSKSPSPMSHSEPRLVRSVHPFPELVLLTQVSRVAGVSSTFLLAVGMNFEARLPSDASAIRTRHGKSGGNGC
jgi:hypothetical protein